MKIGPRLADTKEKLEVQITKDNDKVAGKTEDIEKRLQVAESLKVQNQKEEEANSKSSLFDYTFSGNSK